MNNRRDFLKKVALAGTSAVIGSQIEALGSNGVSSSFSGTSEGGGLIVPKSNGLKITGTFLDEISHDIPHQNWGEKEWDRDFRYMKAIGIDTVILIRSGYKKFITYPSKYLLSKGCYMPSVDLVDMFLRLAEKYGMKFWFGLYDSGKFWETRDMTYEIEHNKYVIDEVWNNYGKYKSFGGWYISGEISRQTKGAIDAFRAMGKQCKDVSGGLPTFISPWIDGKKAVQASSGRLTKAESISVEYTMWSMLVHFKTGISIMTNSMRFFRSIRNSPINTACNVGRMRSRSIGICPLSFSRLSSINYV